jgi:hypothetical protein
MLKRLMQSIANRWHYWRLPSYLKEKQKCDSCEGTFIAIDLIPTSGDWWLCNKCFVVMMEATRKAHQNKSP